MPRRIAVIDDPELPAALDALAQGGVLLFGDSTWVHRPDGVHLAIYFGGDPNDLSVDDAIELKRQAEHETERLCDAFPEHAAMLTNPVQTAVVWDYGKGGVALATFDATGSMGWYGRSADPA